MSLQYFKLNENEKSSFVKEFLEFLKPSCQTKEELITLIQDIQIQAQTITFINQPIKNVHLECGESKSIVQKKFKKNDEINNVKKVLEFDDLSPNVIVYNILRYRLITYEDIKDVFECFGYFKRDRLRNIWFLFLSIDVYSYFHVKRDFYYCVERLKYFKFDFIVGMKNFDKNVCYQFKNLEEIFILYDETFFDANLILKKNKFGKLKKLSLYDGNLGCIKDEYIQNLSVKGIIKLSVDQYCYLIISDTINLQYLELYYVSFKFCKEWGNLSNVENLRIGYIEENLKEFFNFNKFVKLKKFMLEECLKDVGILDNVIVNWKELKELSISNCLHENDTFFQSNSFDKLEKIKLLHVFNMTGNNWQKFKSIKSIKILDCYHLDNFNPNLFFKDYFNDKIEIIEFNGKEDSIFDEIKEKLFNQINFNSLHILRDLMKEIFISYIKLYLETERNCRLNNNNLFQMKNLKKLTLNDFEWEKNKEDFSKKEMFDDLIDRSKFLLETIKKYLKIITN